MSIPLGGTRPPFRGLGWLQRGINMFPRGGKKCLDNTLAWSWVCGPGNHRDKPEWVSAAWDRVPASKLRHIEWHHRLPSTLSQMLPRPAGAATPYQVPRRSGARNFRPGRTRFRACATVYVLCAVLRVYTVVEAAESNGFGAIFTVAGGHS